MRVRLGQEARPDGPRRPGRDARPDGFARPLGDETALEVGQLEDVFRACFLARYRTELVGGGEEPLYLPSADPDHTPHRVVYREDYTASALHEVAHWCLAGAARRRLEDYGYWYVPDGRSAEQQARFERVEVGPQALEWIFSDACGHPFVLSADNLLAAVDSSPVFEQAVKDRKARFIAEGLPPRARDYCEALVRQRPAARVAQGASRASPGSASPSGGASSSLSSWDPSGLKRMRIS